MASAGSAAALGRRATGVGWGWGGGGVGLAEGARQRVQQQLTCRPSCAGRARITSMTPSLSLVQLQAGRQEGGRMGPWAGGWVSRGAGRRRFGKQAGGKGASACCVAPAAAALGGGGPRRAAQCRARKAQGRAGQAWGSASPPTCSNGRPRFCRVS